MSSSIESKSKMTFGLFEVDLQSGELWKAGKKIKIQSQPFKVLTALLEHPGQIVSREELQLRLWGKDTIVDFDHSLGTAINKIREALGDSADNPRFIQTLARRGYRFIAPVGYPNGHSVNGQPPDSDETVIAFIDRQSVPNAEAVSLALASSLLDAQPPGALDIPGRLEFRPELYAACGAATVAGILALCLLLGGATTNRSPLRMTQITHNGRISPGVPSLESLPSTATDGVHIFTPMIENGRTILSQISIAGGDALPLTIPSEIASPSLGALSPDGTRLLLRSHLSPESEQALWVVPVSGGTAQRVANILAHDATWMPNGDDILYAAGNELSVAHVKDGSSTSLATLPGRAFWLRWSPDGRLLRFTTIDPIGHTTSLWELPVDGRGARPILKGWSHPTTECCGSWTADGKFFVFQSSHDGNADLWELRGHDTVSAIKLTNGPLQYEAPIADRSGHRIFFVGLDTRSELLRYSSERRGFLPENNFLSQANRIVYSRDRQWVAWTDDKGRLWRARVDGSETLQLTPDSMQVFLAHWSPDGKHLALMAREPGQAWKIYLIEVDGGSPQLLIQENRNSADPSWSPDGLSLVFGRVPDLMGKENGSRAIQLLDLRTHAVTVLPGSEGLFSPRWSPDGRYIAALSLDERRLMLFDVSSHAWKQLADTSVADPVWSADSKALYIHAFMVQTQPIFKVDVPSGHRQPIADLSNFRSAEVADYFFGGVTLEDAPLVRARSSTGNIYSLDLDRD